VVYDVRHTIIPNNAVYLFALATFVYGIVNSPLTQEMGRNILAGLLLFSLFGLLWLVSQGKWMGLGDVKLSLGMGFALGIGGGLSAVVFAFWIGATWAIATLVTQVAYKNFGYSKLSLKSEIPFAPFLVLGFYIVFFSNLTLSGLLF